MASYKNQHFVPRCYLKPFSVSAEGFAINLYNIDRRVGIPNAAIKGQCSKRYFYGKDLRLEKLLEFSEGTYASSLRDIQKPGYSLTKSDKAVLLHFGYLQRCRTEATLQRAVMSMAEMADIAFSGDVPVDQRITMSDAVLFAMRSFSETMHIVDDLKVCLVRNQTHRPFVTSDDPAVMTNRWYAQSPRARGLTGGIGSAGALIFLPLTPAIMAVIYDGDVYSISNAGGWTRAEKVIDIDSFNEHQFLNCLANIYFADWISLPQVSKAFEAALPNRPAVRHEIITGELESEDDWGEKYRVVPRQELQRKGKVFLHLKATRPQPSRWPSMIRLRSDRKIYYNGTGMGYLRRSTAEENSYRGPPYKRVT